MMCQNFESVPIPYRLITETEPELFGGITYSGGVDPYAEALSMLSGMWVDGDRIVLHGWVNWHWWPSWQRVSWRFNAATGAFIDRGPGIGGYYARDIVQGAQGELYVSQITGQTIPVGPYPDYEVLTDQTIHPGRFGFISMGVYFFDRQRNRAVFGYGFELQVREFQSGTLLRSWPIPQRASQIVYGDGTQVYVLLTNKAVLSINYETGQCFSYTLMPYPTAHDVRLAWNHAYRRMLICAFTPDNPDGTSTTLIRGYRYVPVPVQVCKPIPLKRLRNGVRTPFLIKQIGDLSEGIAGMATLSSSGAGGTLARGQVALDGDGEGVAHVDGAAVDSTTVTASVEVACLR